MLDPGAGTRQLKSSTSERFESLCLLLADENKCILPPTSAEFGLYIDSHSLASNKKSTHISSTRRNDMSNPDAPEDGHELERAPSQHLGPEYRSPDEKPSATVSTKVDQDNVHILPQTPQLIALLT